MTETTAISKAQPEAAKQLPVEAFEEFDRLDEGQMIQKELAKMKGEEFLGEFVYDVTIEGHRVTSLSITGIQELMRHRGRAETRNVQTQLDEKEVHAIITVRDLIRNLDVTGTASCEKTKPFAWTLAVNKAERNAFRKLLPEKLIAGMIREFLERKQQPRAVTAQPVSAEEVVAPKPAEITVGTPEGSGTSIKPEAPIPSPTSPSPQPESSRGPVVAELGSLASISDETLAAELEKLPWRPNKSGKGGWNLPWDGVPQQFRAKLGLKLNEANGNRYVRLGSFSYRRYGDQNEWLARYSAKPMPSETRPTPSPEPPIENISQQTKASPDLKPQTTSKVESKPETAWKVPITANQATPAQIEQGVRQIPLGKGTQSFGMINTLRDEIALCPERPVPIDTALISGFLLPRVVEPIVSKHKLAYTLERTSNGFLQAVLIRGNLDESQIKELVSGSRWAFERALEEKKT